MNLTSFTVSYHFHALTIVKSAATNIGVHVCTLSHIGCVQLFVTLWTLACQAPLSLGFSRQGYWNGLPCPPQGDLPDSGIQPKPALWADSLPLRNQGHPGYMRIFHLCFSQVICPVVGLLDHNVVLFLAF